MKVQQLVSPRPLSTELSESTLGPGRSPLTHLVTQAHVAAATGAGEASLTLEATTEIERFCQYCLTKRHRDLSPHDRDDIVQDVLVKIWRSLASFDPTAHAEPWVSRITSNCAIDFWRRRNAIKEVSQSTLPQVRAERVRSEMFERLSPALREMLELKLSGLGVAQIADKQLLPPNTVKTRLRAARIRIEEALRAATGS